MKKALFIITLVIGLVGLSFGIHGKINFKNIGWEDNEKVLSATSQLTQVINAGTLTVDIVDGAYSTVGSPTVAMSAQDFSFACSSSSGTLGTASEQIYVKNPDAADNGWTLSIAASAPTAIWDSAGTDFDFNDTTSAGCTDGGDTDGFAGQMTINPSGGSLDTGACSSCTTGEISLGTSSTFDEGTTDSITLLTAAAASDDIGDWTLETVSITQTIPPEQPAASDYTISLTVTVTAT